MSPSNINLTVVNLLLLFLISLADLDLIQLGSQANFKKTQLLWFVGPMLIQKRKGYYSICACTHSQTQCTISKHKCITVSYLGEEHLDQSICHTESFNATHCISLETSELPSLDLRCFRGPVSSGAIKDGHICSFSPITELACLLESEVTLKTAPCYSCHSFKGVLLAALSLVAGRSKFDESRLYRHGDRLKVDDGYTNCSWCLYCLHYSVRFVSQCGRYRCG